MEAIQIISQDLFDKVRSRFQNLEMGDKTGAVTLDPTEARFFDFDFINEGVNLGRVSISLNDLGSLKIYYSQGITENKDDISKKMWYNFLKEMRMFAMRRLLRFDTRDIAKTNLDKNDFQYLASKQASKEEEPMTTMNESRWVAEKSTKKTSRAVKGRTQVIVRHTESMAERRVGDRSNPKRIKAIYIENSDGERFKYPFIHPAGAFAMAQHVDHGGIPHDPAGKAIIKMSEQIAQLQEFRRQVQRSTLNDDATGISERAVGRLQELKMKIEALGRRNYYESWLSEFNETEHDDEMLSELDPVTFESYKSTFTQSNFNEELGKLFPLIHSIMQEKVDLEDYVKEETQEEIEEETTKQDAFEEFEQWAEATEQGKLTDDQIEQLKQAIEELPDGKLELGSQGQTAWKFFSEFGLKDSDLEEKLKAAADLDSTTDSMEVLKSWAEDNYPELLVALGMSNSDTPPEAGAQPAAEPEPAAEPAAEPAPAAENDEMAGTGLGPESVDKKGSMIEEIAKLVKSRFNESNPNVGPFNGHEGILLDVEKTISEKFGEKAGKQARVIAEKYMEKLTMKWQQKHGEPIMGEKTDDIQRLKELVGNLKSKLEEKDVDEVQQRNFNPHSDLAGRGRLSSLNKTDAGKKADFNRGTERLKDKMKFTKSQGGVSGPKGPLPEMVDLKKLAGLTK